MLSILSVRPSPSVVWWKPRITAARLNNKWQQDKKRDKFYFKARKNEFESNNFDWYKGPFCTWQRLARYKKGCCHAKSRQPHLHFSSFARTVHVAIEIVLNSCASRSYSGPFAITHVQRTGANFRLAFRVVVRRQSWSARDWLTGGRATVLRTDVDVTHISHRTRRSKLSRHIAHVTGADCGEE